MKQLIQMNTSKNPLDHTQNPSAMSSSRQPPKLYKIPPGSNELQQNASFPYQQRAPPPHQRMTQSKESIGQIQPTSGRWPTGTTNQVQRGQTHQQRERYQKQQEQSRIQNQQKQMKPQRQEYMHPLHSEMRQPIANPQAPVTANPSNLMDPLAELGGFDIFPPSTGLRTNVRRPALSHHPSGGSINPSHSNRIGNRAPTSNSGTTTLLTSAGKANKDEQTEHDPSSRETNSRSSSRGRRSSSPRWSPRGDLQTFLTSSSAGRKLFAIGLLLIALIAPVALVSLLGTSSKEDSETNIPSVMQSAHISSMRTRHPSQQIHSQSLWVNHVVRGTDQLMIAETFESRWNAEVAPVLQNRADQIWGGSSSSLYCQPGERQIVAFSFAKSGAIPASISLSRRCSNTQRSRICRQKRYITDIRDLLVTLPTHSSRYTYSVQIVEDHLALQASESNVRFPRRVKPLGTVSGPFRVELSDVSRLALQRYCGTSRRNFAADLLTEPLTTANTRLLPLFELKRLFNLLKQDATELRESGHSSWDNLQLSKATINPIDHSPHSLTFSHLYHLFGSNTPDSNNPFNQIEDFSIEEESVSDSEAYAKGTVPVPTQMSVIEPVAAPPKDKSPEKTQNDQGGSKVNEKHARDRKSRDESDRAGDDHYFVKRKRARSEADENEDDWDDREEASRRRKRRNRDYDIDSERHERRERLERRRRKNRYDDDYDEDRRGTPFRDDDDDDDRMLRRGGGGERNRIRDRYRSAYRRGELDTDDERIPRREDDRYGDIRRRELTLGSLERIKAVLDKVDAETTPLSGSNGTTEKSDSSATVPGNTSKISTTFPAALASPTESTLADQSKQGRESSGVKQYNDGTTPQINGEDGSQQKGMSDNSEMPSGASDQTGIEGHQAKEVALKAKLANIPRIPTQRNGDVRLDSRSDDGGSASDVRHVSTPPTTVPPPTEPRDPLEGLIHPTPPPPPPPPPPPAGRLFRLPPGFVPQNIRPPFHSFAGMAPGALGRTPPFGPMGPGVGAPGMSNTMRFPGGERLPFGMRSGAIPGMAGQRYIDGSSPFGAHSSNNFARHNGEMGMGGIGQFSQQAGYGPFGHSTPMMVSKAERLHSLRRTEDEGSYMQPMRNGMLGGREGDFHEARFGQNGVDGRIDEMGRMMAAQRPISGAQRLTPSHVMASEMGGAGGMANLAVPQGLRSSSSAAMMERDMDGRANQGMMRGGSIYSTVRLSLPHSEKEDRMKVI